MPQSAQSLVEEILREAGPLTIDELLARVSAKQPLTSKNPKQTIQNALTGDPLCQATGDGRYVYLPSFVAGACMRVSMELAAPAQGLLAAGAELSALLWPAAPWKVGPTPVLSLEDGPDVRLERVARGMPGGMHLLMELPATFWQWWSEQQAGADALIVCCEDGEAARFRVHAVNTASLDADAVALRNAALRKAAMEVVKRSRGARADDLALRLLARGVYHGDPAPDPLSTALFEAEGPFYVERGMITYRPELTPALRRLFAGRIEEERGFEDGILRELLQLPPVARAEPPADLPAPVPEATRGLRIKVALQGRRSVWRVIEILDNQTLDDLHNAIQRAFTWDNDHLYAFFLSGKPWDRLTEISGPFGGDEDPPTTDEVTLADLGLQPGQRFLYVFDFGDNIRHDIEVLDTFPLPARGNFPRIAESHGEAPPQYPEWDE